MISILAAILVSGQNAEAANAIVFTSIAGSTQSIINYTRENEYEADRMGLELLKKSQYDPQAMADFMLILQRREQVGELAGIEYLRTHPISANRIAEITSRLSAGRKKMPAQTRYQQFRDYLFYLYPDKSANRDSRFYLALDNMRNGRYAVADKILQELLRFDPDSLWLNYVWAQNLELAGRLDEAARVYEASLMLYPDEIAITVRLAKLLLSRQKAQQALSWVLKIADRHKTRAEIYLLLVEIYRTLGRDSLRQLAEANFHWYDGNKKQARKLFKALLTSGSLDAAQEAEIRQRMGSD
jgi:predicted Zn-dependent protease